MSIDRRGFLKRAAVASAVAVLTETRVADASGPNDKNGPEGIREHEEFDRNFPAAERTANGLWKLGGSEGSLSEVNLPRGFIPDRNLIFVGGVSEPDIESVSGFPYELAGWRYCKNDWSDARDHWGSLQLEIWHWEKLNGERLRVPHIGSLRDPNGGTALLLVTDRDETDFMWDYSRSVFCQAGSLETGRVWDMSDESHTHEVEASLRDFFLYELGFNWEYLGNCDDPELCGSVTWATVQRWFDGSWRLTGAGEWGKDDLGRVARLRTEMLPQSREIFIRDESGRPREIFRRE